MVSFLELYPYQGTTYFRDDFFLDVSHYAVDCVVELFLGWVVREIVSVGRVCRIIQGESGLWSRPSQALV